MGCISIRYVCTCSDFHTISILCLGRWDNITLDPTSIEDFIAKEEATMLQMIAELDNAQNRERWQQLGNTGMLCLLFVAYALMLDCIYVYEYMDEALD